MLNFFRMLAAAPVAAAVVLCAAAYGEEGGSSLELKHEYFQDRNGVWNFTPAALFRHALSRKWSFGWEQEFDVVSGASRRLGSDKIGPFGDRELDAVSGASKVETRHSENPSLTYAHKGVTATGSFYSSRENDYFSLSPAGSVSWDFNDRNTTLGANYSEFFDDFRPTGAFAGQGGKKRISTLGATLAQTLTPLTLIAFTGTYVNSRGYLGHPYNPPMDATGNLMTEAVPDGKRAGAVAGQIVQGFLLGDRLGSLNLDVRRYQDSWGLKSTTADLKVFRYVADGLYLRLRGRYYNQTGAVFAKEVYTGQEAYRTGDIRFFPFASYMGGAKLSGAFPESWGESAMLPDRWDVSYEHTIRNTHGDSKSGDTGEPRSYRYQLYDPGEEYMQDVLMVGLVFNL
jgi:hypothetical protein